MLHTTAGKGKRCTTNSISLRFITFNWQCFSGLLFHYAVTVIACLHWMQHSYLTRITPLYRDFGVFISLSQRKWERIDSLCNKVVVSSCIGHILYILTYLKFYWCVFDCDTTGESVLRTKHTSHNRRRPTSKWKLIFWILTNQAISFLIPDKLYHALYITI